MDGDDAAKGKVKVRKRLHSIKSLERIESEKIMEKKLKEEMQMQEDTNKKKLKEEILALQMKIKEVKTEKIDYMLDEEEYYYQTNWQKGINDMYQK